MMGPKMVKVKRIKNGHADRGPIIILRDGESIRKNRKSVCPSNYFVNRNYIAEMDLFESVPRNEKKTFAAELFACFF